MENNEYKLEIICSKGLYALRPIFDCMERACKKAGGNGVLSEYKHTSHFRMFFIADKITKKVDERGFVNLLCYHLSKENIQCKTVMDAFSSKQYIDIIMEE